MRQRYPRIDVNASLVDCDGITTGGGVSLCIDATLYIIERELGVRVARGTARIIEYSRAQEINRREFPSIEPNYTIRFEYAFCLKKVRRDEQNCYGFGRSGCGGSCDTRMVCRANAGREDSGGP
jgi:hypothetical protein